MNTKQTIRTTALLACLLIGLSASAYDFMVDGLCYKIISDSSCVTVTYQHYSPPYYTDLTGDLVIPKTVTYNGTTYPVTAIGESSFQNCRGLTSVTIPNSVTYIARYAFLGCSGLSGELTIPNSVTSIYEWTFSGCSGLTSVTIPNSVTSIGRSAFEGCSGLTSVTIPNSVKSIGLSAFKNCTGLTSVNISDLSSWYSISFEYSVSNPLVYAHHLFLNGNEVKDLIIPESVTSIGNYTFSGCSGLTSVTIPNSVTSIGKDAFAGCSGLSCVNISDLESWCNISFQSGANPLTYAHHLILNGTDVKDLIIPESVTSIGNYTFSGCSGLTSVTIPNSVMSIGTKAFYGCSGLADIYSEISNPTTRTTESNAFEGVPYTTCKLHTPADTKHMYQVTTPWNNFENIIEGEGKDPCDINGDGVVDIFDVNAVINRMLGVE